jgi:hypothetical protein
LGSSHFLFSGISDLARYANSMVLRIASCALLAGAIAFGASDPGYRLRRLYVPHGPRVEVTGRVFAFNHRGGTLTVIQAKTVRSTRRP